MSQLHKLIFKKECDNLDKMRKRLIHIHRCRGITRRTMHRLLQHDSTLKKIYTLSPTEINHMFSLPMNHAQLFYSDLHQVAMRTQLKKDLIDYKVITIVDVDYPNVLKQIKDPPLVLYANGDISLLNQRPSISVIGTRQPSNEAAQKIKLIVEPLIDENWLIVSGMAKGIDSYAHHLALTYNGKTIAVLGGGFQHIYPKQNRLLYQEIAEKGLVLSEYPPDRPPAKYHFPERNRIISGMSFGTLVIEAMERSGTSITVDQALDQGREVYAVPGSPLIPQTKGCHQMIQDGAKLVLEAQDILEDWQEIGLNLYVENN